MLDPPNCITESPAGGGPGAFGGAGGAIPGGPGFSWGELGKPITGAKASLGTWSDFEVTEVPKKKQTKKLVGKGMTRWRVQ